MTKDEKRKLAEQLLRRNGYSDDEIRKILAHAWGKNKPQPSHARRGRS